VNGVEGEMKRTEFWIRRNAIVVLIDDLTVLDLQMPDAASKLELRGHTLTVLSNEHPLTGSVDPGDNGKIEWVGLQTGSIVKIR
jgi:hypothetical protein